MLKMQKNQMNQLKTITMKNKVINNFCLGLILLILTMCNIDASGQDDEKLYKNIIGKWIGIKKETKNGNNKLKNGDLMKELSIFSFNENNTAIQYFGSDSVIIEYYIKNKILKFGKIFFRIEKLTRDELILLDYDPTDPNSILSFRHYLKRENQP